MQYADWRSVNKGVNEKNSTTYFETSKLLLFLFLGYVFQFKQIKSTFYSALY